MTPAQIIELVCTQCSVTPNEFRNCNERRVMRCRQITVISLIRNTRLSNHQVAELLGLKLNSVNIAMVKHSKCSIDSKFFEQYAQIEEKITGMLRCA